MAKALGPLFSLDARGTFAKTLIFQGRAGTTAVFIAKKPHDPQSPAQLARREYIRLGVYYWHKMSGGYLTQWDNFVI